MSNCFRQAGWIIEDLAPIVGGKPGIRVVSKTPMSDVLCVVLLGDWRFVAEIKMGLSAIAAVLAFILSRHAHCDNPVISFLSVYMAPSRCRRVPSAGERI